MKTARLFALVSCVVSLCAASGAVASSATPALIDINFNSGAERIATYPPSPGSSFRELVPGFSGWASGGQMQLTLSPAFGSDGTGGVHVEVLKEGKFYQLNFSKLRFPMLSPGKVIRDPLRSLRFSVDAKIPAGKEVAVYIALDVPKDLLKESPWSKRLVLGTLRGTDDYKAYEFSGEQVPEDVLNVFINFVRDMQLNGMAETVCTLTLHMNPAGWAQGEGYLIDNVKLTVSEK
jgi:hypothetical protein